MPLTETYNQSTPNPVTVPRISEALSNLIAEGVHDVSKMTCRERAAMIAGLAKLLQCMMDIGEIEHTNDWDWYVQIECTDGSMYGDYCKDGKEWDYEDPIWGPEGNDAVYCDSFRMPQEYPQLASPDAEATYGDMDVIVELWGGHAEALGPEQYTLKVKDISKITISQR